jgi:hypothetical protein
MSTTIKVNPDYFTKEKTKEFLKDHELACKTMEGEGFASLFLKYDLTFIDDYKEVLDTILDATSYWKFEPWGTQLEEVSSFDSNCIFCYFGTSVKVYKWSFTHPKQLPSNNKLHYRRIGFMFDIKNDCLVNYGTCNAYSDEIEESYEIEF